MHLVHFQAAQKAEGGVPAIEKVSLSMIDL